jgi:hypothetical protein
MPTPTRGRAQKSLDCWQGRRNPPNRGTPDIDWTVAHHPNVRRFPDLASAIAAIMAMERGDRERLRRVAS